jgi:sulfide:quinone oxidoreductase
MYLACDAWLRRGVLQDVGVEFHTATPALFGVKEFVPPPVLAALSKRR